MNVLQITPEWLAAIAGAGLSLLFSYVPGLQEKFARLGGTEKRLVMLALLVLAAGGAYGLSCWGGSVAQALGLAQPCDANLAGGVLRALLMAIMANQGVYAISPTGPRLT